MCYAHFKLIVTYVTLVFSSHILINLLFSALLATESLVPRIMPPSRSTLLRFDIGPYKLTDINL